MTKNIYYAVYKGRKTGIFRTWEECLDAIDGYSKPIYKKFNDIEDAKYFLKNGTMPALDQKLIKKDDIISVFTDGSTIRKGNKIYYGYGVYIPEYDIRLSKTYIDEKPTNNRCELTAILVGINIIAREYNKKKEIHIYTDSKYSIMMLMKEEYEDNTLNIDIIKKIRDIIRDNDLRVVYYKVKAHTGYTDEISIANDIVDKLAYNGALSKEEEEIDIEDYKITFGKYEGYSLKNIPTDYIKWIIRQNNMSWMNDRVKKEIGYIRKYELWRKTR
jgi:ribonuclease HI